jgi:Zn finger protein HypA/HybF involved in hydrogenase expression
MPSGRDNPARVCHILRPLLLDHKPAQRRCLTCGRMFASQGPANRKCRRCTERPVSLSRREEMQARDPQGGLR